MARSAITDFMRGPCSSNQGFLPDLERLSTTSKEGIAPLAESGGCDTMLAARRLQIGATKQLQNDARFALGRPAALAVGADFRARSGRPPGSLCGPGRGDFVLDMSHSFYRKSVSHEIVLRETERDRLPWRRILARRCPGVGRQRLHRAILLHPQETAALGARLHDAGGAGRGVRRIPPAVQ